MILAAILLGLLIGAVLTLGALDWWREWQRIRDDQDEQAYVRWLAIRAEARQRAHNAWMRGDRIPHTLRDESATHTEGWD